MWFSVDTAAVTSLEGYIFPSPTLLMYTAKIWSHRTANYFYESNETGIWLLNQDVIFSDTKI